MAFDGFIQIPFTEANLDRYLVRKSILDALNKVMPQLKDNLLDIGCGKMPYRKYILENSAVNLYTGIDIENALVYDKTVLPDLRWDGRSIPLSNDTYQTVITTEVLEHCFEPEVVLREINRVLKPGGIFFFTVPFLWNLHEVPNDAYRYTPFSLERHLQNSGFSGIQIFPMGGWHASMAQMLGLWVRRAPMKLWTRKYLSILLKPCIMYLIGKDTTLPAGFNEGQMITGLYGWAEK